MKHPFEFGGVISAAHFINRKSELDLLEKNFISGQNTILISPRRWGKSSLVNRAAVIVAERHKSFRIIKLDLLAIRTEGEFLEAYLSATLKALGRTIEKSLKLLREVASILVPKLTFSAGPDAQMKVGVDWKQAVQNKSEILELPQRLAEKYKLQVVVAIDEFQGIAELVDVNNFDAVLRTIWQHHQNVCYCLYGSKRHMMLALFTSYSAPFYHFGDTHVLEKISREHWVGYIVDRFERFNKQISNEVASWLASAAEDHSHYVQQVAQIAYGLSNVDCTQETAETAFNQLIYQLEPFFSEQVSSLSRTQLGFLAAVLNGEVAFSSSRVLKKYNLGTSANASKLKVVMQEKEIIQLTRSGEFEFVDPLFKAWYSRR